MMMHASSSLIRVVARASHHVRSPGIPILGSSFRGRPFSVSVGSLRPRWWSNSATTTAVPLTNASPAGIVPQYASLAFAGVGGFRLAAVSLSSGNRYFSESSVPGNFPPSIPNGSIYRTNGELRCSPNVSALPLQSIVKVFTVSTPANHFLPWQRKPQSESTGSGCVIDGRRILTNAHVVADQTFVQVRKHGDAKKYVAQVEHVGHECDLALLKVNDPLFWLGDEHSPPPVALPFGGIPDLQDSVAVVGFPTGGDNISITDGVVSRVSPVQYAHGAAHLLAIQIDAAINPGNSGGPVVNQRNEVIGVAFQNLIGAENIGYVIPSTIIQHFLTDIRKNKRYVGFCGLGVTCQQMENHQLRKFLKLAPNMTGVLVNRVLPLSPAAGHLRERDVILKFDHVPIENDGTVPFRRGERIPFDYLVNYKYVGDPCVVTVLREGQMIDVPLNLFPLEPLVPVHVYDKSPSYFIYAGMVFTTLTQPYLHEYGEDWYNTAPRLLCHKAIFGMKRFSDEQIVLLSQVLVDEVNVGYQSLTDLPVKSVNGHPIRNLRGLKDVVESAEGPFIEFTLIENRSVVIDKAAADLACNRILVQHSIPSACSHDLNTTGKP